MSEFKIKVGVELDESGLKDLKNLEIKAKINLTDVENQIKNIKKLFKDAFKLDKSVMSDIKKIESAVKALSKLQNKNKGDLITGGNKNTSKEISNITSEYKDLANTVAKLQKQLTKGGLGEESVNRTKAQIQDLTAQMEKLKSQMSDKQLNSIKLFDDKLANKNLVDMNNYMNKIEATASSLGTKLNSISFDHIDTSKIEKVQAELEEIQTLARQGIDLNFEDVGKIVTDLAKISNEIKNLEKVENLASSFDKIKGSISASASEVESFGSSLKELENNADKVDGSFERMFKSANDGMKKLKSSMNQTTTAGKGFGSIFGTMDDFLGNFSQFTLAEVAGDFLADGIRRMATAWKDTIVETDRAITDMMKVAPESFSGQGEQLKQYLDDVTEVAKNTGKTSVDVIGGVAKALQSGIKEMDSALEYSQKSAIFANVGDIEQEQADTMLASIMSAYGGVDKALKPVRKTVQGMGKDYDNLTNFVDQANYAGNNFAVSTADIGEALSRSASALQTNGVSMEESVGMIIGMNEIVQDSGKTGNALKTISANLAGVSASAKDGTIQTNKTAKALKEIAGIEVWNKQTGEIKDMYSTMDELHSKWSTLNEDQQNALGTAIAGKTQLNTFNALMSNWDTVTDYVDEYNKGLTVGSAQKENLRYLDSIDGKWNTIKENMKSVANTLTTGDMAKGALDIVIGITEGLDKGVSAYSEMVSIMSDGTMFKTMSDGMFNFLDNMDYQKIFGNFSDMIGELTKGKFNLGEMFNLDEFGASLNKFFDSSFGNKLQGTLSDLYGGAMKILEEIALPPGIEAIFDIGRKFKEDKALENSIEERNRNLKVYADEIASLKAVQEATKQLAPAYEELSNKQKRSAEEEQKLIDIRNQLAEINPESVLGYDKDGNAILRNLDLSNAQLERQIKLKQQSQRLEENALANDVQAKRIKDQKEYNKLLEEAYNLPLTADTDRKDSLFTGLEDISDYAKRIQEQNQKINEENAKIYSDRLQAHQQYVADEKAIQEKYINQMEGSQAFGKMAEEAQRGILSFMDTLDWSSFTDGQATSLTNQLSRMSDKIVETTKEMGNHAKSIDDLEQSYANGEKNMISYTEGLGKIYETAKKVDAESLSNWKIGLEDYASLTGDLDGVNACIERMAQSLTKVTGINTDTWKKALTFDPAPIDASNQALQRFLNSYKTGVQNLGKGGLADVLQNQFQNLQTSHLQLVDDLASGKTIDVEYLINAKVNQPKPIRSLIDEIIEDGNVDAVELEVLIEAQTELLNEGSISEETKSKIADIFGMSETEVEQLVKVNAKVETNMADFEAYVNEWEELDTQEKELILRSVAESEGDFEATIEKWDTLSEEEKQQILKQIIEKDGNVEEAIKAFEGVEEGTKEQTLEQKSEGSDEIKTDNEYYRQINSESKEQKLEQKSEGSDELKTDNEYYRSINSESKEQSLEQKSVNSDELKTDNEYFRSQVTEGEKKQTLNQGSEGWQRLQQADEYFQNLNVGEKIQQLIQKASGKEEVEESSRTFDNAKEGTKEAEYKVKSSGGEEVEETAKKLEGLPKVKEVAVSIVQKGGALIDSVTNFFNKKAEQTVNVEAKVTSVDTSKLKINETIDIKAKVGTVDTSALNAIKNQQFQVNVTANTSQAIGQVNSLKSAINGIQTKTVTLTANASGAIAQVNSLKTAINSIQSKAVTVSASVSGTANVNTLKASIASLQGKSVSVSATTSGTGEVNALTTAINTVQGKTVSVTANVNGTSQVNSLTSAINKVKSKSVKVSASVSGTGAVQSLASAIASVRSKTVSVRVNRTITESTVQAGLSSMSSMSMLSNDTSSNGEISMMASGISNMDSPMMTAMAKSTSKAQIDPTKVLKNIDFDISPYKNLEEALKRIALQFEIIEEKSKHASGRQNIGYLKEQIALLRQQQEIQVKIVDAERVQNNELKKALTDTGFKFNEVGDIINYQEKLLAMEENVESLRKKADADSKNESLKKQYDSANETLSKTKKYLEEYFKTNNEEIDEAKKKWYEYENKIKDTQEALKEYNEELKKLADEGKNTIIDNEIKRVESLLNLNDIKMEDAGSEEQIRLLNERIDLTKRLQQENMKLMQHEKTLADDLKRRLGDYGLQFEDDGDIKNYAKKLVELRETLSEDEFDKAYELIQDYYEKITETIPNLREEIEELNSDIKDSHEEIQKLKDELEDLRVDSGYKDNERDISEVENLLEKNDNLLDRASGKEYEDALNEKINLTRRLQKETNDLLQYERQLREGLMKDLGKYGFTFRDDGSIEEYGTKIQKLKETLSEDEFEKVFDMIEDYLEKTNETIPDIENDIDDMNNDILDAQQEMIDNAEKLRQELVELKVDLLVETAERAVDEMQNLLDLNDAYVDGSQGSNKAGYLGTRIELLQDLQQEYRDLINANRQAQREIQNELSKYSIGFDSAGGIDNYQRTMLNLKNTLDEDTYSYVEGLVDRYLDFSDAISDANVQLVETENEIAEIGREMERIELDSYLFHDVTRLNELNSEYDRLASKLEIIGNRMEYAYGYDKMNAMRDSIALMNEQLAIQEEKINSVKGKMDDYRMILFDYGFEFDENGIMTNYEEIMAYYQHSDDVEHLTELTEEYLDLQSDELPGVIEGYEDLQVQIKDMNKEMLEVTRDVEEEITKIYEKEYEKKKEIVEDYADERIKLLNKEKEAYKSLRDEQQYDKTIKEQTEEVADLQKRIDVASKDTSLSGQKRMQELIKELAEAKAKLEETTQDKIDSDFEQNIDDEIEKLENERDTLLDNLANQFSEENIAYLVQQALASGFIEIDGQIQTIQQALLDSINNSADAYSVMAGVIKNELVANLNVALETMRELENIHQTLGLQDYGTIPTDSIDKVSVDSTGGGQNISIGDTYLSITGGEVSETTIANIEALIDERNKKLLQQLSQDL